MHIKTNKINYSDRIEKLRFALKNQIEWQKHAEGKNIIFLTITAGTLLLIYGNINSNKTDGVTIIKDFGGFYVFFMFTSLISFFSSLVSLNLTRHRKKMLVDGKINLISWYYVIHRDKECLRKDLEKYDDDEHIDDLILQHLYGSKITDRKYRLFKTGMIIYSLGVIGLIIKFVMGIFS